MTDLTLALEITALGMGLVFGAILLLWLMMVILTALTADKEPASDSGETAPAAPAVSLPPTPFGGERVAAIAVALALAEQEQTPARALAQPPTALVSAWQLGMRTRQMSEKNIKRH